MTAPETSPSTLLMWIPARHVVALTRTMSDFRPTCSNGQEVTRTRGDFWALLAVAASIRTEEGDRIGTNHTSAYSKRIEAATFKSYQRDRGQCFDLRRCNARCRAVGSRTPRVSTSRHHTGTTRSLDSTPRAPVDEVCALALTGRESSDRLTLRARDVAVGSSNEPTTKPLPRCGDSGQRFDTGPVPRLLVAPTALRWAVRHNPVIARRTGGAGRR
jgi:hypothetical protein